MMLRPNRRRGTGAAALALALALGGPAARAQQAPATIRLLPEDAERRLGGHQHNFYFLPPGQTGEVYQSAGFFGQRLRPYLAGNPEALDHLADYRRQKTLFLINRALAVGAVGLYGGLVFSKDRAAQYTSPVQLAAGGVFAGSLLTSLFINLNTNSHLQRAVEAHNAGRLHGAAPPRWRPATGGIGLNAGPGGGPTLALGWQW